MPAAAVIPAPVAYIKVVAVKKLVVEHLAALNFGLRLVEGGHPSANCMRPSLVRCREQALYCEKIRVFQAGNCPNTLAWNNGLGFGIIHWLVVLNND